MTLTQSRASLLSQPSRPEGNQTMGPCVRRQPQLDLIPLQFNLMHQSPTWLQPHASIASVASTSCINRQRSFNLMHQPADSVGLRIASETTTTSWTHSLLMLAQGQTRRSLSGVWSCAFNTTPYIDIRPSALRRRWVLVAMRQIGCLPSEGPSGRCMRRAHARTSHGWGF